MLHWICLCLQTPVLIRGSVHPVHLASVMRTPPVHRFYLTCVPVTRPAATGVNAIQDSPVMDLPAQVSYFLFVEVKVVFRQTTEYNIFYSFVQGGRECTKLLGWGLLEQQMAILMLIMTYICLSGSRFHGCPVECWSLSSLGNRCSTPMSKVWTLYNYGFINVNANSLLMSVMLQISTSVQRTTGVVLVLLPALTMWSASHAPVHLDTPMTEPPAQVSQRGKYKYMCQHKHNCISNI